MKLSEIIQEADKLPNDQKETILKIIDLKVEEQMKDVKQAIEMFGLRFTELEKKTSTELDITRQEMRNNQRILYWLLGIIGASIIIGITIFVGYLQFLQNK